MQPENGARAAWIDQAAFDGVLAAAYDLALSPRAWPSVLALLGRALRCHCAAAIETTPSRDAPRSLGAVGITAEDHRDFLQTWHRRSIFGRRAPARSAGAIVLGDAMVPRAELVRSDMYREYLAPRGIQEVVRLDVFHDDERSRSISLARPTAAGAFTAAELGFARAVMPHLARAAATQVRLEDAATNTQSALEGLDAALAPVLLLDGRGRLLYASAEGERMLRDADGLSISPAGLRAATPALSARLVALIDRASGTEAEPGLSGTLRLARPSGKPELIVVGIPVGAAAASARRAKVLLQVIDPMAPAAPDCALAAQAFGLTRAESELAGHLLRGMSLAEAAAASGRSVATMRTHLANLLAKTETTRQSELVRLLMRLPRRGPQQNRPGSSV